MAAFFSIHSSNFLSPDYRPFTSDGKQERRCKSYLLILPQRPRADSAGVHREIDPLHTRTRSAVALIYSIYSM